ncbi:hypothetical protein [Actinophytocola sp.]|uniref:hypothetical protein n=1 Tax=Actinophytocola sp. TaxID=1872138 RepID=UPI00389A7769
MTDTTLTRIARHRSEAGTADTAGAHGTAAARLVVRWDGETGWAHLAVAVSEIGRLRFAGFHRFANGSTEAVLAELAAAGCVTASEPRLDDDLLEIDALFACREVATGAAR